MSLMNALFETGEKDIFKLCDVIRETSFAIH